MAKDLDASDRSELPTGTTRILVAARDPLQKVFFFLFNRVWWNLISQKVEV